MGEGKEEKNLHYISSSSPHFSFSLLNFLFCWKPCASLKLLVREIRCNDLTADILHPRHGFRHCEHVLANEAANKTSHVSRVRTVNQMFSLRMSGLRQKKMLNSSSSLCYFLLVLFFTVSSLCAQSSLLSRAVSEYYRVISGESDRFNARSNIAKEFFFWDEQKMFALG